jgi:hypothetical protein
MEAWPMAAPMACEAPVTMTGFFADTLSSFFFLGLDHAEGEARRALAEDACRQESQRQIASLKYRVQVVSLPCAEVGPVLLCLFRFYPGFRTLQLYGHISKENVKGLAIGGAAVLR